VISQYPIGGYLEKLLRVDLTKRETSEESLNKAHLSQYIGGTGLGAMLLWNENKPKIEPYSPENRIIFMTGPLTGTLVPGSGTYSVITRNTLTGLMASAQANGFFGARLKYAGYDGIIIQGRAEKPVYLHIESGNAEIEDASELAGKDTFQTEEWLRKKYGEEGFEDRMSIAAIGPAGEKLVRFACIVSDRGHIAASGGVGAVMGSKNLKAIVVHGDREIPISSEKKDTFLQMVRLWREESKNTTIGKIVNQYGSLGFFTPYHSRGWVPVKNLTTNIFPKEKYFDGAYLRKKLHRMQPKSCHGCTFKHCHVVEVLRGKHKGFIGEEPEYEILAGFGPNWGNYEPGAVTVLNDLNDRLGMDAKEVSFLLSMLMEGYEKRWITKNDLDGINLKWGNVEASAEMLKKIAKREGIGDWLAEGVMRASQKLGGEFRNIAVYVKRGNAPHIHDLRTRWGTVFTQAISNTGSQEGIDMTSRGAIELGIDKPTLEPDEYIAEVQTKTGSVRQFSECLIFCYYQTPSLRTMINTLNTLTGSDYEIEGAMKIGRRVINLLRMLNIREGLRMEDDTFSFRIGMPPVNGPGQGKSLAPTFEKIRSAYYKTMGWDQEGMPTHETLNELGLGFTLSHLGE
jgi:aldehyde:ferredoxin oxidoreductase